MFQQNHLVPWIIHFLNSRETSKISPTLERNASENYRRLKRPIIIFFSSAHLLVYCFLLRLKQNFSGVMIQLSFCGELSYREMRLNDSVGEKFDNVLQNVTALELILMLRHTAIGLYACRPGCH